MLRHFLRKIFSRLNLSSRRKISCCFQTNYVLFKKNVCHFFRKLNGKTLSLTWSKKKSYWAGALHQDPSSRRVSRAGRTAAARGELFLPLSCLTHDIMGTYIYCSIVCVVRCWKNTYSFHFINTWHLMAHLYSHLSN